MRTLTGICDRADVAYAIANQKTRPSWGYRVSKDAAGMWEPWDQDTQGPGMNGQGFLMLACDLNAWIYQCLAVINPDPQQPGFKHIVLKPQPVSDLTYVNCSYKSMYGRIVSNWKRNGNIFVWQVAVPANTKATVYVPAKRMADVMEGGKFLDKTKGVKLLRMEDDRAVLEVTSGNYEFSSRLVKASPIQTKPPSPTAKLPDGVFKDSYRQITNSDWTTYSSVEDSTADR